MRTVPSSRANSSKLSRLELEPVLGKRSRSASEEPNYTQVSNNPSPNHTGNLSALEIRGSETLLQSPSKVNNVNNTPGTRGGPGSRDQMLTVKRRKDARKSAFFVKKTKIR